MTAFAACFRSVMPEVDAIVPKLRKSIESFWTVPHADLWPGAVPSVDFSSDQSDVEAEEAAEEEEEAAEQPARKRKARQESAAKEAKPAKKAKKAAEDSRVGRVVAVPAWKFGRDWADKNFHRPMSAMLIGDITGLNRSGMASLFA